MQGGGVKGTTRPQIFNIIATAIFRFLINIGGHRYRGVQLRSAYFYSTLGALEFWGSAC